MAFHELNITSITNLQEQIVSICSTIGWDTATKNANGTFTFKPKSDSPQFTLGAETNLTFVGYTTKFFTLNSSTSTLTSRCDGAMTFSKAWVKADEWGLFCVFKTHVDSSVTWFQFGCFENTTDCYVLGLFRGTGNSVSFPDNGVSSLWQPKNTAATVSTLSNFMVIDGQTIYIGYYTSTQRTNFSGFYNSNTYRNVTDNNLCLITGTNVIAQTPLIYTLNSTLIMDRMVPHLYACSTKNVECFKEIEYNTRKFMVFPCSSLAVATDTTYISSLTIRSGVYGFALEID